jgi:hypothetical protein
MYDEDLLMLPYMGITAMIGWVNFILYIPLILHGFLESGDILVAYLQTLNFPIAQQISAKL